MPDSLRRIKVLIVDDEPDMVTVVEKMLAGRDYSVSHAHDGATALEIAARHQPDLVLLDVMLPEQDGWLVCAKIKSVSTAPKIIMFTVLKHGEADRFAQFVHADDILHKPFTREQLLRSVDRLLTNPSPRPPYHEDR